MKVRSLQFAWFMVGLLVAGLGFLWWLAGNNKAACISNQRQVQFAVRRYEYTYLRSIGTSLDKSMLVGPEKEFRTEPACPSHGPYQWSLVVPIRGEPAIRCSHPDHQLPPSHTKDW
jgi:hypothetical protein